MSHASTLNHSLATLRVFPLARCSSYLTPKSSLPVRRMFFCRNEHPPSVKRGAHLQEQGSQHRSKPFQEPCSVRRAVKKLSSSAGKQQNQKSPAQPARSEKGPTSGKESLSNFIRQIPLERRRALSKMKSHIQFITTPTADTPGTSLLLHFDDKRYVIGQAHEGLQRAGLQLGTRFLKTNDFFITGKTEWKNTGGLLGMVLTLADGHNAAKASRIETNRLRIARAKEREEEEAQRLGSKDSPGQKGSKPRASSGHSVTSKDIDSKSFRDVEEPRLRIHGGPNLLHTLATSRSYIFRQGMPLDVSEFGSKDLASGESKDIDPDFQDSRIQLWALPALPSPSVYTGGTPRPTSPRKRSLAEYMAGQRSLQGDIQKQSNGWHEYENGQYEEDQKVRHAVVSEMFDSTWRKDAVVEMRLEDVKLPATVFLRDPDTQALVKYRGPLPGEANCDPTKLVLVRKPWPGAMTKDLPPTKPCPVSMSYIVKTHPQRGKFRAQEAKKLGVPPGPLFSRLSHGFDVELENGKTVTPDMVLEPSKEGTGVAILDVPSVEYIPSLFNRPEWLNENVTKGLGAFIWLLGPNMAHNELLESFMKDFKDVKHLVSSPDTCTNRLVMTSAAAESLRHRQIYLDQFPPLQREVIPPGPSPATDIAEPVAPFIVARQGLKLQLQPSVNVDESSLPEALDEAKIQSEMPEEAIRLAQQAQKDLRSEGHNATGPSPDLESPESEIITLGTGSALPSQYRNVSGTIVRVPGCGSYLLDCGENTLGQLRRMHPPEKVQEILRDMKVIWISHNHADHHLGMTSMIRAWYEAVHNAQPPEESHAADEELQDPVKALGEYGRLFVISNQYMLQWLKEYSTVEDFGYDWVVPIATAWGPTRRGSFFRLDWNGINVGPSSENRELFRAFSTATGLSNLSFCLVEHCTWAYAVSMTCRTSFKFSYSGDCRPSAHFAAIGADSTVLIHEATFDDELQGEAIAKKHSTISEAAAVGVVMRAKRILLTHFSQRYAKLPKVDDLDKSISPCGPEKPSDTEEPEDTGETSSDGRPVVPDELHVTSSSMQNPQGERPTTPEAPSPNESLKASTEPAASPNAPSRTDPTDLAAALKDAKNIKVGVAFDYMCVKVKDIELLEKFTPAMRELYKDREPVPEASGENDAAAQGAEEKKAAESRVAERQKERARKQQAKAKKPGKGTTPTKEVSSQDSGVKDDANGDGSEAQNGVVEEGEKMAAVG